MKAEINIEIIAQLLKGQSSKKLMLKSLDVFHITKNNRKRQLVLFLLAFIPAVFVGTSPDTKNIMVDSFQTVLEVIIALFGVVFTGYAFFQALINKELLVRLISNTSTGESKNEEKSKLQESNESFVECMMLNLIAIIINLLMKICVNSVPDNFLVFEELLFNNMLAIFVIVIYFYFVLTVIWEVKSFIFNIFQLFNAYAGTRVLDLLGDDDPKKHE